MEQSGILMSLQQLKMKDKIKIVKTNLIINENLVSSMKPLKQLTPMNQKEIERIEKSFMQKPFKTEKIKKFK